MFRSSIFYLTTIAKAMFISALCLLQAGNLSGEILLDKIVAVVGDDVITWSELYSAMEFETKDQISKMTGENRVRFLKRYEKDFLEKLIDTRLQLTYARQKGLYVSEIEIGAAMKDIRDKYGFSEEEYRKALKQEGFTYEEYSEKLGEQIILNKLINEEIKSKIIITEEEISRYIEGIPQKDKQTRYRLRQIFLLKKEGEDRDALMARGIDIYKRLQQGEDFKILAIEFSDGPNSDKGGELGFIKADEMGVDLLEKINRLKRGEYTSPFITKQGLHIMQMTDRKGLQSEKDLKNHARIQLLNKRFQRDYSEWIKSLKERIHIKIMI